MLHGLVALGSLDGALWQRIHRLEATSIRADGRFHRSRCHIGVARSGHQVQTMSLHATRSCDTRSQKKRHALSHDETCEQHPSARMSLGVRHAMARGGTSVASERDMPHLPWDIDAHDSVTSWAPPGDVAMQKAGSRPDPGAPDHEAPCDLRGDAV
jgi:hypothetical protein